VFHLWLLSTPSSISFYLLPDSGEIQSRLLHLYRVDSIFGPARIVFEKLGFVVRFRAQVYLTL